MPCDVPIKTCCPGVTIRALRGNVPTRIRKLRDGGKFKSWIHYIALNLCRDRFRSPRSRVEILPYQEGGAEDFVGLADRPGPASPERLAETANLGDLLRERGRIEAAIVEYDKAQGNLKILAFQKNIH